MIDWSTPFPYLVLCTIFLFGVGIYGLISARKFIRIVFSIIILIFGASLLLISFSTSNSFGLITIDPLLHSLLIFIFIIGLIFVSIGIAIDRQYRKLNRSTKIEFTFVPLDIIIKEKEQSKVEQKNELQGADG